VTLGRPVTPGCAVHAPFRGNAYELDRAARPASHRVILVAGRACSADPPKICSVEYQRLLATYINGSATEIP
jgi:hypothetical protein